jgi:hypothetical protein
VTQAHRTTERRDTDQVPDDSRARLLTRRKVRDRVILTQPPPPPPMPARPERDEEDPPAPEPTRRSADERLLAIIDELISGR